MVILTFMSFSAIVVTGTMWLYNRLSQEDKLLLVEGLDESVMR